MNDLFRKTLHFPDSIDSTMLTCFGACPQKFFLEFILRRAPVGRSIHLHAGGCFAKALEVFSVHFYKHKLSKQDALVEAFRVFVLEWGTFKTPEKEYKDFVNVWSALVAYLDEYPPDTDRFQPVFKADGEPAVEFKFAIPLPYKHPTTGNPLLFSGRADALVQNGPNSCLVRDEKTTKALGQSWYYQWAMRGQFHGYTYAAREYGFQCEGALVRGIAIQQTQFGFAEVPLFFTDGQLERWYYHTCQKVERMLAMWERAETNRGQAQFHDDDEFLRDMHDSYTMSFGDACNSYGGCEYTDVCVSDCPWDVYRSFEKRIWDPLAQDPAARSEDRQSLLETLTFEELLGQ